MLGALEEPRTSDSSLTSASAAGELAPAADAELRVHVLQVVVRPCAPTGTAGRRCPCSTPLARRAWRCRARGVSGADHHRDGEGGRACAFARLASAEARTLIAADARRSPLRWSACAASAAASAASRSAPIASNRSAAVDQPARRARDERLGVRGVGGDELALAECRRARSRRSTTDAGVAESGDVVQQPRLRRAVAGRSSEVGRLRERRSARRADRRLRRGPPRAELLLGLREAERWERGGFRAAAAAAVASSPAHAAAAASSDSTSRRGPSMRASRTSRRPRRATGMRSRPARSAGRTVRLLCEPHERVGRGGGRRRLVRGGGQSGRLGEPAALGERVDPRDEVHSGSGWRSVRAARAARRTPGAHLQQRSRTGRSRRAPGPRRAPAGRERAASTSRARPRARARISSGRPE